MDLPLPDRGLFTQFYTRQHGHHGRSSSSFSFPCTPETYEKMLTAARQESKVHAEIQLLYFYESMRPCSGVIRPRVICSEKHACFLCDIFIRSHAQFYAASTHGTFYSQWRLPKSGEFKVSSTNIMAALHRFNTLLEEEIMARLVCGPKPNPSVPESVLVEAETFTPSIQSSVYDKGTLSYASTINEHEIPSAAIRNGLSKLATVPNIVSGAHLDKTLFLESVQGTVISVPDNPTGERTIDEPTYRKSCTGLLQPGSSLEATNKPHEEDENATFVSGRRSISDFGRPTCSTSRILALDGSSKDSSVIQYAKSEQVIAKIIPDQNLTTSLSPGCTIQVNTPYIHLHLEYASIAPRLRAEVHGVAACSTCTLGEPY